MRDPGDGSEQVRGNTGGGVAEAEFEDGPAPKVQAGVRDCRAFVRGDQEGLDPVAEEGGQARDRDGLRDSVCGASFRGDEIESELDLPLESEVFGLEG